MKKVIVVLMLVCCMTVVTKGTMVAHYDFEGNLNDSTGNGWNGAAIGDIGYGTSYYGGDGGSKCLQLTSDGKVGGNDGVLITGSGNLLNNEGSLTIALWYKAALPEDAYPYSDAFVGKLSTGAGWNTRYTGSQGQISFAATCNPTGNNGIAAIVVNDGEWHHLIFTFCSASEYLALHGDNHSRTRIFVDGVQVKNLYDQTAGPIVSNSSTPITIGVETATPYKNGAYGWIDDVRLYDNFMETVDAYALYDATVPEPATMCILALGSLLMVNRKR